MRGVANESACLHACMHWLIKKEGIAMEACGQAPHQTLVRGMLRLTADDRSTRLLVVLMVSAGVGQDAVGHRLTPSPERPGPEDEAFDLGIV